MIVEVDLESRKTVLFTTIIMSFISVWIGYMIHLS